MSQIGNYGITITDDEGYNYEVCKNPLPEVPGKPDVELIFNAELDPKYEKEKLEREKRQRKYLAPVHGCKKVKSILKRLF